MRMEQVEVYCSERGFVCIKIGCGPSEEGSFIFLTPEQVPLVIRWLKSAMKEACEIERVDD